jgi:hypothetical protein
MKRLHGKDLKMRNEHRKTLDLPWSISTPKSRSVSPVALWPSSATPVPSRKERKRLVHSEPAKRPKGAPDPVDLAIIQNLKQIQGNACSLSQSQMKTVCLVGRSLQTLGDWMVMQSHLQIQNPTAAYGGRIWFSWWISSGVWLFQSVSAIREFAMFVLSCIPWRNFCCTKLVGLVVFCPVFCHTETVGQICCVLFFSVPGTVLLCNVTGIKQYCCSGTQTTAYMSIQGHSHWWGFILTIYQSLCFFSTVGKCWHWITFSGLWKYYLTLKENFIFLRYQIPTIKCNWLLN